MNKRFLKLLPLFLSVIVSAGLLVATSMAWLAMNKNVSSEGMQMQIEVTPNLVISDTVSEGVIQVNVEHPYTVTYSPSETQYAPSTHDLTTSNGVLVYSSGLKYVDNVEAINVSTGLENSGAVFVYDTAVNAPLGTQYYVDKVVYIAALSGTMEDVKLVCSIDSATKEVASSATPIVSGSLMATSIDIYEGTTIDGSHYKGTLNVATMNSHTVYVLGGAGVGEVDDIPQSTSGYLTYTLRFYFDGALESTSGQAYIYSELLDTSKITINVKFSIPS